MKRIIKFFIFKIVEVAGAVFFWGIMTLYGHLLCLWIVSDYDPTNWEEVWLFAPLFAVTIGCILPGSFCILIFIWIKWNWEKAGRGL